MTGALCLAAALACIAADSPWGIAAHPHSEMEWKNIDRQLGMMRDAGMTSLRHDMKFSGIAKKKGQYDFSRYDELLEKLDEYGIHFLPILEGYDWEIVKSRPDAVPLYRHPEEWRSFVRACARHYKGKLRIWEIWNEQDGGFWKPNPNAAQYVPLLKIAYEELKAADPENIVIVGGLCGWNTGYLRDMYAAGARGYFDAIAVHPYGWGPDRSIFQQKRMAEFKAAMAERGDAGKPLWITECGGSTNRSNLIAQQSDVLIKAIEAAARKIGRTLPEQLVVGAPVSQEYPDRDFAETRNWLPGAKVVPVTPGELAKADPAKLPVFLGCEHTTVEEAYQKPMLEYVKKGGILLAFGEVPMYNIRYRNKQGNWSTRGAADELHPYYGIGYQAWWTKPGAPKFTMRARTTEAGREAGIGDLRNVYTTRFLTAANVKEGDAYTPLVEAIDGRGEPAGEGIALYTFKNRKGAILGCTIQFAGGFTEQEQAHLLQTLYLSYLADGIDRLYFYDFHCDGESPAERENNFGIVRWNYAPKPAYSAYREMTAALGRAPKFAGRVAGVPPRVQALVFERAEGGKVLAVWSTGENARFEYNGKTVEAGPAVQFIR
ncbi:MAG: cellulase family glycosylhydrolase [Lentisphaeria bacterium]|nr:cellulase family glycosylhydrolase [Lentisphaeria bacterium]